MKKIISLMLAIIFISTFSACDNKNTPSDTDTTTSTQSKIFIKPENYTSVLLVSINPQFKLYIDENYNVLAVEPVNDDAKSFSDNIDFQNKSIEIVIGNIVEEANEKGFIKENVTVDFGITEQQDGISVNNILTKAVSATQQKATEFKIEIKTQIKEKNNLETTESDIDITQITENSKPSTTTTQKEETSKKEEITSKTTTTTKSDKNKPTHTHSYSPATCTAPQKCSCGSTKGSELGHKWQEATCKSPKICAVCNTTEGDINTHIIENGVCKFCKQTTVVSPKGLDTSKTYIHVSEINDFKYDDVSYSDLIKVDTIGFSEFLHIGEQGIFSSNKYDYSILDNKIKYNGKDYYHIGIGGVGIGITYEITEHEIIIRDENDPSQYATLNLLSDGSIKVIFKTNNFYGDWETQVGWVYTPSTISFN